MPILPSAGTRNCSKRNEADEAFDLLLLLCATAAMGLSSLVEELLPLDLWFNFEGRGGGMTLSGDSPSSKSKDTAESFA